nr:immunoglobulin heavy chain junction region [Mus musculus]
CARFVYGDYAMDYW